MEQETSGQSDAPNQDSQTRSDLPATVAANHEERRKISGRSGKEEDGRATRRRPDREHR